MLAVTFDTSCCIDLFRDDASPEPALVQLVRHGLRGRLDIAISSVVRDEIEAGADAAKRQLGLDRLAAFPDLRLPVQLVPELEALAGGILSTLFPNSPPGTTGHLHNERDCRHLAAHALLGRDIFVTLDERLAGKARAADRDFEIRIRSPKGTVEDIQSAEPELSPVPASLAARPYRPEDEAAVRALLAVLVDDYPDFNSWLTRTLRDESDTTVTVGILNGQIAGVAIWKKRDTQNRAVKLSAFRISEWARSSGLAGHLLFHALRAWVDSGYTTAWVTTSADRTDAVDFFTRQGFMIEGISPLRYRDGASEVVMGRLMLRKRLDLEALKEFARDTAPLLFGRPGAIRQYSTEDRQWFVPPRVGQVTCSSDEQGSLTLRDTASGELLRDFSAHDLETLFYPLRVAVPSRRALIVPIRKEWADAMLLYPGKQEVLFEEPQTDRLLIRAENAYYCFPRCDAEVRARSRILFYVSWPLSSLVGEAIITQASKDIPEVLYELFGSLGIYDLGHIKQHVPQHGPNQGRALALRFGYYVPFARAVSLHELRSTLGFAKFAPQGLHPIQMSDYEALRSLGGLDW